VITSGLGGDPAPPLLVSLTDTLGVPQLSDTVASDAFGGGTWLAHCNVRFAGGVTTGGGFETFTVALPELFGDHGSAVEVVTLEVPVIVVASATLQFTRTTSEKAAEAPDARVGFVQVTVPTLPTSGAVHVHPPGAVIDSKTVFAGTGALTETPDAGS